VDDEEKMREIAPRLVPGIKMIIVPSDLNIKSGEKAVIEYLEEQVGGV
jgi:hypothetical protein